MRIKHALLLIICVVMSSWVTSSTVAKSCRKSCGSSRNCGSGRARYGGCQGGGAWFDPYWGFPYNSYGGWGGGCWGGCGWWPGVSFNFYSESAPTCQERETVIYSNNANEFRDTNNDLYWNITNKTSDTISVKNAEHGYIMLAPNQSGTLSHMKNFTMYVDQPGKDPFEFTDMAHEITIFDDSITLN